MTILRFVILGLVCVGALCEAPVELTRETDEKTTLKPGAEAKVCQIAKGKEGVCVAQSRCATAIEGDMEDSTEKNNECDDFEVCCEKLMVYEPTNLCGVSRPGLGGWRAKKKTGRFPSDFGEFPWMVAMLKTNGGEAWAASYIGGGTIIHPSVVLTAAHKVDDLQPEDVKCRAGEWNTHKVTLPYQERQVTKIVMHEEFTSADAHNDVALLIIAEPFVMAPHVGIGCLGQVLPTPGTQCYSMGFGHNLKEDAEGVVVSKLAVVMKKIPLKLVSFEQCENSLDSMLQEENITLDASLMCAGGEEGVDTCVKDGGSSLVCPLPDSSGFTRYAVYGIVAYGVECGVKDVPGVYVNIPHVYQWIKSKMEAEDLPVKQFEL